LDVLSHLTGCLLGLRGKLFRGSGLRHEKFQEDESDEDSDEDNSSNALGGKVEFLLVLHGSPYGPLPRCNSIAQSKFNQSISNIRVLLVLRWNR
jgi:hypothetical protein